MHCLCLQDEGLACLCWGAREGECVLRCFFWLASRADAGVKQIAGCFVSLSLWFVAPANGGGTLLEGECARTRVFFCKPNRRALQRARCISHRKQDLQSPNCAGVAPQQTYTARVSAARHTTATMQQQCARPPAGRQAPFRAAARTPSGQLSRSRCHRRVVVAAAQSLELFSPSKVCAIFWFCDCVCTSRDQARF